MLIALAANAVVTFTKLVAGILSGAVSWLIALLYKGIYTGGLLNEVTTFAAFTALLVFVPGIIRFL